MAKERHVDALMKKLVQTIEASLAATEAARDAVQEILKRGADTGIFFAGSQEARHVLGRADAAGQGVPPGGVDQAGALSACGWRSLLLWLSWWSSR